MIMARMKRLLWSTVARRILLGVVWTLIMGYVFFNTDESIEPLNTTPVYTALLTVIDDMAELPESRLKVLHKMDQAIRDGHGRIEYDQLMPLVYVREKGQLIYHSDHAPAGLANSAVDKIEFLSEAGNSWRARTLRSDKGSEVMIALPANGFQIFLNWRAGGFYLIPLMVSIPILLIPAWLSIQFSLRPWRRVVDEIAARGPHNMTPISDASVHERLRPAIGNINALLQRVRDSALRERSFIADAAHELRTPIAAMRVNVEALQKQTTDPRQHELLSGILNSCDRAARMAGQLLLLMRSETRDVTLRSNLSFSALVQDRVAMLSALADVRGVELALDAETDVFIHGQKEGLMSLVDNLVGNAIKYSPPGGLVQISVLVADNGLQLVVADQGPGIVPGMRERVFDRFYRVPDQLQQGSGLGLTIVRAIVEQHAGSIKLDDAPGGGLLVVVWLPS